MKTPTISIALAVTCLAGTAAGALGALDSVLAPISARAHFFSSALADRKPVGVAGVDGIAPVVMEELPVPQSHPTNAYVDVPEIKSGPDPTPDGDGDLSATTSSPPFRPADLVPAFRDHVFDIGTGGLDALTNSPVGPKNIVRDAGTTATAPASVPSPGGALLLTLAGGFAATRRRR